MNKTSNKLDSFYRLFKNISVINVFIFIEDNLLYLMIREYSEK